MAGTATNWIKIRIGLPDDPRVIAIAEAMGIEEDEVVGKLVRVWGWADDNVGDDGVAEMMNFKRLDRTAGLVGFSEAMSSVGWLVQEKSRLIFPDYTTQNGSTAKSRAQAAKRQHQARQKANITGAATRTNEPNEPQKPDDEPLVIPEPLNTPEFCAKWDEWFAFRRENKFKKWKPSTAKKALQKLAAIGVDAAIQTLEHSMGNGYQGLFPEKFGGQRSNRRKPEPSANPADTRVKLI